MVVAHLLTFPGLFSTTGLLGAGPQSTAWLYMLWHSGFPVVIIAYALWKDDDKRAAAPEGQAARDLMFGALVALAAAVALTLLATWGQALLPPIMQGNSYSPAMIVVVGATWALSFVALIALWMRKPHTMIDLWLMVVMCAWIFDIGLSAVFNAGRFDLGFYAGRVYGLLAATFVLLVLLVGTARLYARLAQLLGAEQTAAPAREQPAAAHLRHIARPDRDLRPGRQYPAGKSELPHHSRILPRGGRRAERNANRPSRGPRQHAS